MSRKPAQAPEPKKPGLLPVPEPAVWHHGQTLFAPMREWRIKKRVPPVLLLTGLPGVGKRTMAYFLSQWILCERTGLNQKPAETEELSLGGGLFGEPEAPQAAQASDPGGDPLPCGECASCQKAIHGHWIDFAEITAEDDEDEGAATGALKIEQFRKLKASLGFGAHEGSYKIVLIPNADRMTIQAANSMLKLLEEPPAGWVFFLTASDPTLLLPTIVSRCQTIRLKPLPARTLEELLTLAGVDAKKRPICAQLAQGSWGKALAWSSAETWERRKAILDFLKSPGEHLNALVDWATLEPQNLDRMIDQLESLTADLIRWTLGPQVDKPESQEWVNSDAKSALIDCAKAALRRIGRGAAGAAQAREIWLARAERMAQARQMLQAPLNRKLLAQDLLLPWLA